jgi:hypothetical protein
MAGSSERMVPVDFSATILYRGRDGSMSKLNYEKEYMLPAGDIERGKTDERYRTDVLLHDMISHPQIMSLKRSWYCFSCQGSFHKFFSFPSGLTDPDENGRVPCKAILLPVCSDGRCTISSTQEFHSILAQVDPGIDLDPDPSLPLLCRKCKKSDDASEQFKQCSRCKVTYYCNRDCQKAHWKIHKKECRIAPS